MKLDLYIKLDNGEFTVLDNSSPITTIDEVTKWTIDIYSMVDNKTVSKDIIHYVQNDRISYEISKFKPEDFGLTEFKDGIYKFTYNVNNNIKEGRFIVYSRILKALDTYIKNTNYTVSVGEYDLEYAGIEIDTKGDLERINLANSLFIELQQDLEDSELQIILDKLFAILEINNT